MRKLTFILSLLLSLSFQSFAQRNGFVMESVDPVGDSLTVAKMRAKMAEIRRHRPTVGLVLAGGGAKGAAHVGILKYLEEQKIPVDVIIGTSMGGLMGGLYSVGYSADEIENILNSADWDQIMSDNVSKKYTPYERRKYNERFQLRVPLGRNWLQWINKENDKDLSVFPDGYISGFNVVNMLSSLTVGYQDSMDFADLPIPFFCVATDLTTLKEYNYTRGSLPEAMRSTMSIPLYFTPVRTGDKVLIDGGTRNNFPVDIARAMGADFVIGIDLSKTKDKENVKGVTDIISQSINLMGKQSYDINRSSADIYIHPDMDGMGMMSFDSESIATLIRRGYDAISVRQPEIDSLKAMVGTPGIRLQGEPAIDISKTPIHIQSMSYSGLDMSEGQYFFDKSSLMPGQIYFKEQIEEELAHIYGTGAFKNVRYAIGGDRDPYYLKFICDKGFVHNIGLNLRADNEEYLALFANIGFNANKLCGFKYTVDAKIAANPYLSVDVCYTPIRGWKFGISARTRYMDCDVMEPVRKKVNSTRITEWYNTVDLYTGSAKFSDGVIRTGVELEHMPLEKTHASDTNTRNVDWKKLNVGVFADLRFDNMDNGYFPTRGLSLGLRYKYVFYGQEMADNSLYNYSPFNMAKFDISGAIPIVNRFYMIPTLMGRFVLGTAPLLQRNRIGGIIDGRYCESQLPYIGYSGVYNCDNIAVTGNVDFRFSLTKKDFLSLTAAFYNDSPDLRHLKLGPTSYAFAVKYSRNSILGPLRAYAAWANNTGFIFSVSAGFDF